MSALPLYARPTAERVDPIRHGLWCESVQHLQAMQHLYVEQRDLFKLMQSVGLQAFGGYGVDALRVFLIDVFLPDMGWTALPVGQALASCYLRWRRSGITPLNMRQFLVDLINTCEVMVKTPPSPWYASYQRFIYHQACAHFDDAKSLLCDLRQTKTTAQPNTKKALSTVVYWYRQGRWADLQDVVTGLRQEYETTGSCISVFLQLWNEGPEDNREGWRLDLLTLMLHVLFEPDCQVLPPVTEHVNLEQVWAQLFPANLALPTYSPLMAKSAPASKESPQLERLQQQMEEWNLTQ